MQGGDGAAGGASPGTLRGLLTRSAPDYAGHNPAGGAMVIVLLLLLAVISVTGWLMTTTAYYASEVLEEIHEGAVDIALICVFLHIAGVIWSSVAHRENLVRAMITGRKRRH